MKEEIYVPALAKGLDLLELIIEKQGISFNQLKDQSGLNVATLSRTLNQLSAKGYVYKNTQKQYYPGHKIASLDIKDSYINQIRSLLMPRMEQISAELNLTIMLVLFSQDHMVVIDKVTSENNLSMMNVGSVLRDYEHHFWGLFHLLSLTPTQQSKILDYSKSASELYMVRPTKEMMTRYQSQAKEGYITDFGKIIAHATRFAVPIYNVHNVPIGTIAAGAFNECIAGVDQDAIKSALVGLSYPFATPAP